MEGDVATNVVSFIVAGAEGDYDVIYDLNKVKNTLCFIFTLFK
jgi:hypothetical protein